MRYRSRTGRETTTTPAAQADHGLTPDSVTQSPRQQQQASQIAALRSPAAAPGGPIQLMQGQGQPADDRNWWQRYAPYALGGKAPQENRGYLARWLPTALGGQPEPQAPAPTTTTASKQVPRTLTRKEIIKREEQRRTAARKEERKQAALLPKDDAPSSQEPSTYVPSLDLGLDSGPSKSSKRRANARARKQEEEDRLRAQAERELQERLDATRKLPRRVIRFDRNFNSVTNNSGQGKAHRTGSDLAPAGNTPTTAVEQLHQDSPNKGTSYRTSFSSLRAAQVNDYSAGGTRPSVEFKARKHARAVLKGKPDASGFASISAPEVLRQVDADWTPYATTSVADNQGISRTRKKSARNFARRDGESQTRGRIPARFLRWSNTVGPDPADSDSDDETTDEET